MYGRSLYIAPALAAAFLLASGPLPGATGAPSADTVLELAIDAQMGGSVTCAAVEGTTAYLGMGPRLVVVDLSEASRPAAIGRTGMLSGLLDGVTVADGSAYAWGHIGADAPLSNAAPAEDTLAGGPTGMRVIDVRDPTSPRPLGFYASPAAIEGVAVVGAYVYVAAGELGLRVVDASDPAQPREVASLNSPDSIDTATDIASGPDFIVVVDGDARRLVTIDAADPATARAIGSLPLAGDPYAVAVAAPYAYVASRAGSGPGAGFSAIDVSDPAAPRLLGTTMVGRNLFDVAVVGSRAYVLESGFRCTAPSARAIDVTNPDSPEAIDGFGFGARGIESIVASAQLVLVADREWGLLVTTPAGGQVERLALAGGAVAAAPIPGESLIAVAGGAGNGLDLVDPAQPEAIAPREHWAESYGGSATLTDLAVGADGLTYVTYGQNCDWFRAGLFVFDWDRPLAEAMIGDTDLSWESMPGHAAALALSEPYAYVADESGWLSVVDVSRPVSPTRIGVVPLAAGDGAEMRDVALAGSMAYVAYCPAWEPCSVPIIDVSDPAQARLIGSIDVPGRAWSVAVAGSVVFVADAMYGIHAYDVTDPQAPVHLGANTSLNALSIEVVDGRIYAIGYPPPEPDASESPEASLARYLWVLDASDPASLRELGRLRLLDARSLAVDGDQIAVASGASGLVMVHALDTGQVPASPTPGSTRTPVPTSTSRPEPWPSPTVPTWPTGGERGPSVLLPWVVSSP